jgi:hypothetical protein
MTQQLNLEELRRIAALQGDITPESWLMDWAAKEIDALRAFAQAVMEAWPMGDIDGDILQEIAVKHGILKPETRHEPCGETCSCSKYVSQVDWEDGVVCYRITPLLTGENLEVDTHLIGNSEGVL